MVTVCDPGHQTRAQITCAKGSRWRATPGSDDLGHSPDDERAYSVYRGPLLSESQVGRKLCAG